MATKETQPAKCEDCGKRVARFFGPIVVRYPQGVVTSTGYICGECMVTHHEDDE